MKQIESQHQKFVFQVLTLNEDKYPFLKWIHAIPNGGQRHPAVAAKLKAEGVKKGIADIFIPFPCHHENCSPRALSRCKGCYIEMKAPKGKVTPEQQEFLDFVDDHYYAKVAYSCDEALDTIEEYCGIKLRGRK